MCNVGLPAVPTFIRSLVGCGVHKAIMEIDGVEECGGPKLCGEAGAIEESPNFNARVLL
jgi:hypothetical protein